MFGCVLKLFKDRGNLIGLSQISSNPTALRKAKIVYNFGLSECNRVNTQQAYNVESTTNTESKLIQCYKVSMLFQHLAELRIRGSIW